MPKNFSFIPKNYFISVLYFPQISSPFSQLHFPNKCATFPSLTFIRFPSKKLSIHRCPSRNISIFGLYFLPFFFALNNFIIHLQALAVCPKNDRSITPKYFIFQFCNLSFSNSIFKILFIFLKFYFNFQ
jgi:hypothetical protein